MTFESSELVFSRERRAKGSCCALLCPGVGCTAVRGIRRSRAWHPVGIRCIDLNESPHVELVQPLRAFRRTRLKAIILQIMVKEIRVMVIIIIKTKASKNSKLDLGTSKFESGASRAFQRWRRDFLGRPGARYSAISVFWLEHVTILTPFWLKKSPF